MGMTEADDVFERGTAGIEASFEKDLAGKPGLTRVYTDVHQNSYDAVIARKPEPGANMTLTIDSNLQYEAEKMIEKAVRSSGAHSGSIVAMNPYTGEVLAMANYPTYDPNDTPNVGRGGKRAQQSGGDGAVRAGQRVQDGHAFGCARNRRACARTR